MIRIKQIKIPIEEYNNDDIKKYIQKKIRCKKLEIDEIKIIKESIDARKKPNIYYVLEVDIKTPLEKAILKNNKNNQDIDLTPNDIYMYPKEGKKELKTRPMIIGSGPAGLFCAYILAEKGYKPIIIERGEKISDRVKSVEKFWKTGNLNPD